MDALIEREMVKTENHIEALKHCSDFTNWGAWSECNVRIAFARIQEGDPAAAQLAALTAVHCIDLAVCSHTPPALRSDIEGN